MCAEVLLLRQSKTSQQEFTFIPRWILQQTLPPETKAVSAIKFFLIVLSYHEATHPSLGIVNENCCSVSFTVGQVHRWKSRFTYAIKIFQACVAFMLQITALSLNGFLFCWRRWETSWSFAFMKLIFNNLTPQTYQFTSIY